MTIALVDPSPSAVILHSSGLISIRLADYVGPARGTLSTDTDALAAAGTCVVDEQEIAAHTTISGPGGGLFNRYQLADDTAVIPITDLTPSFAPDRWYEPFISLRVTGEVSVDGKWRSSLNSFPRTIDSASVGMTLHIGTDSSPEFFSAIRELPNGNFPNYLIRSFDDIILFPFIDDSLDVILRVWGVSGGSLVWRAETLYLVPWGGDYDNFEYSTLFPNDGILRFLSNGNLFGDFDDDPSGLPFGGGKFSVLPWQTPWAPDSRQWGQVVDFQKADDQPTMNDLSGGGTLFTDPKSRLMVPVGASFVPGPLEIMLDDFSFAQGTHAAYGVHYVADIGAKFTRWLLVGDSSTVQDWWDFPTMTIRGTWVMPATGPTINPALFGAGLGGGFGATHFGDSTARVPQGPGDFQHPLPDGNLGFAGAIQYGASDLEGGFSATEDPDDPRLRHATLYPDGMETFVAQAKSSVLDNPNHAGHAIGLEADSGFDGGLWARLAYNAGGTVTLAFYYMGHGGAGYNDADVILLDGPVTIAGSWSVGDEFWTKVEKRGYYWRARAWADGDPEPSTWDIECFEPLSEDGGPAVEYPWDDEWVAGGAANDLVAVDPRGGPRGLANFGWLVVRHDCREGQTITRVTTSDLSCYHIPEDEDPTEMYVRMEKYDGGEDYGTVTIPWGAHRFVEGDLDNYTFNEDENGINVSIWKHADAPDWMTAGISRIMLVAPIRVAFVPQIYRRVYG